MSVSTKVKMKLEGTLHEFETNEDETVLEAALRNDIDVPYGCMSGTCNACQAKVSVGKVEMEYCDALSDEEVAEGEVLTCQAKATTAELELEFPL